MTLIDYEHNFFGRQLVLDILRKRIAGVKEGYRQNVALLGSRTIGKTAIMRKLIDEHEDLDVLVLYLDLEGRDFNYFVTQFTKNLLYHYLRTSKLAVQEDLKLLCMTCRDTIPLTVAAVENITAHAAQGKTLEAYASLLGLSDIFHAETKKSVVLIFDEFQNLANFGIPEVFAEFGKRVMTQKNCLYIVTSSYQEQARAILSEKLSLLFGDFEVINVAPFDTADSGLLIERHLEGIKIGGQLKKFIADFTAGHPLYINVLCQEMIYLCGVHNQKEIFTPILTQAVEQLLFNPWGILSRHFELMVLELCKGKAEGPLPSLLIALSGGKHRISDLAEQMGVKSAQVTPRINALVAADIVEKNGNFYHLKDKMFRYWLKFVYERRLRAIELESGKSRKLFKEEIEHAVNDFHVVARKDLPSRMVDLLHKFDGESFDLAGRKYKLSMFKDIAPLNIRMGAGRGLDAITANGEEGQWLIVLKKEAVCEQDLNVFIDTMKKMSPKPQRCVIVTLIGLDDNAKIRALQEKLWVWNEEELNMLMRLHDEPAIIQ